MLFPQSSLRASLIASVSFSAIFAAAGSAQAQDAPPVEEVLVTGSLIRGSAAVGVPVTALSTKDFTESGAVTVGELMHNIPAAVMVPVRGSSNHGFSEQGQQINLHGLDSRNSPRDLLMVDGMRDPPGGHDTREVDPSIIPTIAIDHVDVLIDGASAVYGSDAITGVVNVILKRGFDGARTQVRFGRYPVGGEQYQLAGLWGRTWDGGDVTVSFEWYDQQSVPGHARPGLTNDFTPWGLDNRTPIAAGVPGVVSVGAPAATIGLTCANCFSIPQGQNGIGLLWTTVQGNPGIKNSVNPYLTAWDLPQQQRTGATLTFDQRLFTGVKFVGSAYYSNRRVQLVQSGALARPFYATYAVPTNNPYYPIGAPAGLRVTTAFATESPPNTTGFESAGRYAFGFDFELPHDWTGKLYMSMSQHGAATWLFNEAHANSILIALGNTITAQSGFAAYTKPANLPYLNVFCDPHVFTCNSQATLDYIEGFRLQLTNSRLVEKGLNFNGSLFSLPGGEVKAAVGATYSRYSAEYYDNRNDAAVTTLPVNLFDPENKHWWAVFGQVNVPIFGEANAIPLFQKLEIEGSWRHDQFSDVGGASNPKVAFNWVPVEGLTVRGTWGTSFRAPAFQELSPTQQTVFGFNTSVDPNAGNLISVACTGGVPAAGSAAAKTGAACGSFPGGIAEMSSAGSSAFLRGGGFGVTPERATNYGIGFEFAPTQFLKGLDVEVTYYKLHISNLLTQIAVTAANFNDPNFAFLYITPKDVGAATFATYVDGFYAQSANVLNPANKTNIQWMMDGSYRNFGYIIQDGLDFSARYDWDMDEYGSWEVGVVGTYTLKSVTASGIPGTTPVDSFHQTLGTGAVLAAGVEDRSRLVYRGRLAWTDSMFTITGFVNYASHYFTSEAAPPAAFLANFPNYSNIQPSYYTFDLSVGYSTRDRPSNDYLKNLSLQIVAVNLMDRPPPFQYQIDTALGAIAAYNPRYADAGRLIEMTITKDW